MPAFEASVDIDRPVAEVFAYLSDLSNDASWRQEWVESVKTSDGPIGVGTTFCLTGQILGRRLPNHYETTEFEPNRQAAWKSLSMPLTFRRAFEPTETGTRVTMSYDGEFKGVLKLLAPLAIRAGKRALSGDIPKLLEVLGPAK